MYEGFEMKSFEDLQSLHNWLVDNYQSSPGIWVRLYRVNSKIPSVTFLEVLEEGLCYGWSENLRHPYDDVSYLQRFTPRKGKATESERNKKLIMKLENEGRMTQHGYDALGMKNPTGSN